MCLLCDWLSIIHTHKICFGAGNRPFVPRKSGVITQPVYLGRLPILAWAGPAEPSSFGSASCLAPRLKCLQLWSWRRERGRWGSRAWTLTCWCSGCSPDLTDSPVMSFWQASPFFVSGRSRAYQKQPPNRPFLTPTLTGNFPPGAQSAASGTRRPAVCSSALGRRGCQLRVQSLCPLKNSDSAMKPLPWRPR